MDKNKVNFINIVKIKQRFVENVSHVMCLNPYKIVKHHNTLKI